MEVVVTVIVTVIVGLLRLQLCFESIISAAKTLTILLLYTRYTKKQKKR